MHCFKLGTLLAMAAGAFFLAFPAMATCMICDEVVEFDQARAACFASEYERYLEAARNSPTRSTEIDLTGCTGASGDESRGLERMRSLFPSEPATVTAPMAGLRSVYILDEPGIVCLGRLIETHQGPFDPARFDLYESCGQ